MDAYPDTFAFVQIHHGDAWATSWGDARFDFYGFEVYPSSMYDGTRYHRGPKSYSTYLNDYLNRRTTPTDVAVHVAGTHVGGHTYGIKARVCVEPDGAGKTMRIYMVQVLDYWPPAISYSRDGFKQAAATEDIILSPGQCQVVERDFTFDDDSWASRDNIKIIAWAQEPQDSGLPGDRAQVFQAAIWQLGGLRTCEIKKLIASHLWPSGQFGCTVAASGDLLVSGARGEACATGILCGAAYIYRWSGSTLQQVTRVTASDESAVDRFGSSVSVSDHVVLVGAPYDDHIGELDAGSAYVYRYNGSTWIEEQKLTATVAETNAQFGSSVAIDDDVAFVGTKNEGNTGGSDGSGAVYVFRYNGANWVEEDKLTASDAAPSDQFGSSVSVFGDEAFVGAPLGDCDAGADCGALYVYRWNGSTWVQEEKLTGSDAAAGDQFGASVSANGDLVIAGAPLVDCTGGFDCGAVYLYHWNGTTWADEDKLTGRSTGDLFGWSVSLHGNVGLVGAPSAEGGSDGEDCGAAYLVRPHDNTWRANSRFAPSEVARGDAFGAAVALSENMAAVGAMFQDFWGSSDIGLVYTYAFPADCNSNGVADACDLHEGMSEDLDGDNAPDECNCPAATPVQCNTIIAKNRYLSFTGGDPGTLQAIRITFLDLPSPFEYANARTMWVAEPKEYTERSDKLLPSEAPDFPMFWAATLQCEPYFVDWSSYGHVYVFDEAILPGGTYGIQAIDEDCVLSLEHGYSTPLLLTAGPWGDICGPCDDSAWDPPDGSVDVTTDVTAVLDKFKNAPGAPIKARSDIEPSVPDLKVNISDAVFILDAFRGESYPFSGPVTTDPCR